MHGEGTALQNGACWNFPNRDDTHFGNMVWRQQLSDDNEMESSNGGRLILSQEEYKDESMDMKIEESSVCAFNQYDPH
jgi:hypothetical protein